MITVEKLKIYQRIGGDIDGWSRSSFAGRDQITGQDWKAIDELLQSLKIIQDGEATPDFEVQTHARMGDLAENEDVCADLRRLAQLR